MLKRITADSASGHALQPRFAKTSWAKLVVISDNAKRSKRDCHDFTKSS